MKRLSAILVLATMVAATSYGTYVWGWYSGHEYQSAVAGMSSAAVSISAARSLRQSNPELALQLLETDMAWMNATLSNHRLTIPAHERVNLENVLSRLQSYQDDYAANPGS